MRITHRQLEAFIQFMETGTVTAAAERMLVTQPAMSKMLAGLEIDLNLTLFQREKRRLIPTDEARLLYNEVRRLFASLADVERFADDLRSFRTGELRLITGSTLGLTLVADSLADFCPSLSCPLASLMLPRCVVAGDPLCLALPTPRMNHRFLRWGAPTSSAEKHPASAL